MIWRVFRLAVGKNRIDCVKNFKLNHLALNRRQIS